MSDYRPANKLYAHVYWQQKREFMFERDVYDSWTLFAPEAGRFSYEIGEEQGEATFGDLVLCPPHIVFRRETLEPLTFHFIQFIRQTDNENITSWQGKQSITDITRLTSNYHYLRKLEGWDEESTQHKLHLVNDLLRMTDMDRNNSGRGSTQDEHPLTFNDEQMTQARVYLTEHAFKHDLSMLELALTLGLTPVQLTRRFRKAFAQTPSAFLNDLRISRARSLLQHTTYTLDVIASQCGYENGFYLSRVFTHHIGMAPSVYRSMHRV